MNAISRSAFASLTLLFALSAFIQIKDVDHANDPAQMACTSPAMAAGCEMGMITGSTSKTADNAVARPQLWVQI